MKTWSHRLERERQKAMKQVEGRLAVLQTRAKKERRAVSRMVDEAVQRALAALNIPSRQEVQELTRRVEELSRKIDGFRALDGRRGQAAPVQPDAPTGPGLARAPAR